MHAIIDSDSSINHEKYLQKNSGMGGETSHQSLERFFITIAHFDRGEIG